jgi:hypothetical protein
MEFGSGDPWRTNCVLERQVKTGLAGQEAKGGEWLDQELNNSSLGLKDIESYLKLEENHIV